MGTGLTRMERAALDCDAALANNRYADGVTQPHVGDECEAQGGVRLRVCAIDCHGVAMCADGRGRVFRVPTSDLTPIYGSAYHAMDTD